jgi:hypothetical protein
VITGHKVMLLCAAGQMSSTQPAEEPADDSSASEDPQPVRRRQRRARNLARPQTASLGTDNQQATDMTCAACLHETLDSRPLDAVVSSRKQSFAKFPCLHGMLQGVLSEVLAAASRILGAHVAEDQPLMEAGLDSLGAHDTQLIAAASMCVCHCWGCVQLAIFPFCTAACCSNIRVSRCMYTHAS